MLTIQKAKAEMANPEPPPAELSLTNVYIEGPHTVVHVSTSLSGMSSGHPLFFVPMDIY